MGLITDTRFQSSKPDQITGWRSRGKGWACRIAEFRAGITEFGGRLCMARHSTKFDERRGASVVVRWKRVAYLGASVILLAVLVDPFLQQILSYPLMPIQTSNAMIPRAQAYDANIDAGSPCKTCSNTFFS